MLDESLLDDPQALARADTKGQLLGVAAAGSRVRRAARCAVEAGVADLKPDGRPRTVIVAGPGPAPAQIADLLGALASCPVQLLPAAGLAPDPEALHWTLPGWAGPLDLLLLTTPDGTEPGLIALIEQAYRRGCTVASVAPAGSPLAEALLQVHGLTIPFAEPLVYGPQGSDPSAFWAMLTPLLALTDRIGLLIAPPATVESVADRLDDAAERFGPTVELYRNPAKTLAAELSGSLPLVWNEGAMTGPVARRFATSLTSRTGHPALAAPLPEALDVHRALLDGALAPDAAGLDDFFRDRVDEPEALRLRIVLLREQNDVPALAAHDMANAHATPLSEIDSPPGTPSESLAELLALTDFTTVYLALASREGPGS